MISYFRNLFRSKTKEERVSDFVESVLCDMDAHNVPVDEQTQIVLQLREKLTSKMSEERSSVVKQVELYNLQLDSLQ